MVSLILVTPHAEESVRIVSKNRWRRIGFDHYEHPRPFSFLQSHSWARIPVIVVCVGYQVSSMGGVSGGSEGCTGEHGGIWEAEKAVEGNREGSEGCGGGVGREGINRAEERQGEEGAFN